MQTVIFSRAMTPKVDTGTLLTIIAAGKEIGCSRQTVYAAAEKGLLQKVEIGGVTFITKKSVREYRKSRRPRGPKPKHRKQ